MTTDQLTAPDGISLTLETFGQDPELLVLPRGGALRGPEYLGDLAGLAQTVPFALLHPRGSDQSGGPSRGWWEDADDAAAAVTHLALAEVDVLAHSAGTRVALALAARYPERVRRLVLVTPAASWLTGTEHDAAQVAARRQDQDVVAPAMDAANDEPTTQVDLIAHLRITAPLGYAAWGPLERRHDRVGQVELAAQQAFFRNIPSDAAGLILTAPQPPTLVVAGREDILSGVEPVNAYARALGAQVYWIEDCGHYPWVEQPAEFREAVASWLRG